MTNTIHHTTTMPTWLETSPQWEPHWSKYWDSFMGCFVFEPTDPNLEHFKNWCDMMEFDIIESDWSLHSTSYIWIPS